MKAADSDQKGKVLEAVVAQLHSHDGVHVETRVKLPVIRGTRKRRREIDVLLTGHLSGHPVRVAIECKNYGKPIGVKLIGEFRDKLDDVGIPVRQGIYVSVHGYTADAIARAGELGIRTLVLNGLTADRLDYEVRQALQSAVFLLATIEKIVIESGLPYMEEHGDLSLLWLIGRDGEICGMVPDLIWLAWTEGKIPYEIGSHQIEVELPPGWYWQVEGINRPNHLLATVRVDGLVISEIGKAEVFGLADAASGALERAHVRASFEFESRSYPVKAATSEAELRSLVTVSGGAWITFGRTPLPRIRWQMMFWPPSDQTLHQLGLYTYRLIRRGFDLSDVSSISLLEVEGTDLSAIWLPISETHPSVAVDGWPNLPLVN